MYYRKPKPETMRKNRESYKEVFKEEISWLKENIQTVQKNKNKHYGYFYNFYNCKYWYVV